MSELEVRIERLDPMRVASVHGFGESPESLAWNKLIAWAEPRGLLDDPKQHRIFGFNNPNPSPGSPKYGYEFWICVGSELEPEGDVEIKEFPGGLYAVTRVKGIPEITKTWHRLGTWCENSKYKCGGHQWLEEHVGTAPATQDENGLVLDLFCPITE